MDNFYATAERMYNDTDLLIKEKRWFSSCYFMGYIIECYAKLVLSEVLGKNYNQIIQLKHDLKKMNIEVHNTLSNLIVGGYVPPSYIHDISKKCPTISSGSQSWDPKYRYNDGSSRWDEPTAKKYYLEIEIIILTIVQMKIDGVIK